MEKDTLDEFYKFGEIEKGNSEKIYMGVSKFRGCNYFHIRIYSFNDYCDKWLPTKKGVALRLKDLDKVIDAIEKFKKIGIVGTDECEDEIG